METGQSIVKCTFKSKCQNKKFLCKTIFYAFQNLMYVYKKKKKQINN
jgi:hypothetical protein